MDVDALPPCRFAYTHKVTQTSGHGTGICSTIIHQGCSHVNVGWVTCQRYPGNGMPKSTPASSAGSHTQGLVTPLQPQPTSKGDHSRSRPSSAIVAPLLPYVAHPPLPLLQNVMITAKRVVRCLPIGQGTYPHERLILLGNTFRTF